MAGLVRLTDNQQQFQDLVRTVRWERSPRRTALGSYKKTLAINLNY